MQKGYETHFGEEEKETEVFQGAFCILSFSGSFSFSSQLHPPFFLLFHFVEAAWITQVLLKPAWLQCLTSSSPTLSSPPAPALFSPSACCLSKAESFGWSSSGFWILYCPNAALCAGLCVDMKAAVKLNDWYHLICFIVFVYSYQLLRHFFFQTQLHHCSLAAWLAESFFHINPKINHVHGCQGNPYRHCFFVSLFLIDILKAECVFGY